MKPNSRRQAKNQNGRRRILPDKPPNYPQVGSVKRQTVQPVSKVVELNYDLSTQIFSSGGGPIILDVYKVNSPYDFLQSLFTQNVQFLNYMFALYGFAKVQSLSWKIYFGNLEQVPIDIYWFETPFNPVTSFSTRQAVESMASTGNCIWRDTLTEQYGKKSQLSFQRKVSVGRQIVGNKLQYDGTPSYACTAISDPTLLVYSNWVAVSPNSTILSGITCKLDVSLRILFYERLNVTSPLFKALDLTEHRIHLSKFVRDHAKEDVEEDRQADLSDGGLQEVPLEFRGETPLPSAVKVGTLNQVPIDRQRTPNLQVNQGNIKINYNNGVQDQVPALAPYIKKNK